MLWYLLSCLIYIFSNWSIKFLRSSSSWIIMMLCVWFYYFCHTLKTHFCINLFFVIIIILLPSIIILDKYCNKFMFLFLVGWKIWIGFNDWDKNIVEHYQIRMDNKEIIQNAYFPSQNGISMSMIGNSTTEKRI